MQIFKFNAGSRSVERAVADAIGQAIAREIAARRDGDDSVPQRFAELIARLDGTHCAQAHNTARFQSRKARED